MDFGLDQSAKGDQKPAEKLAKKRQMVLQK
jgi:hypothetical protein